MKLISTQYLELAERYAAAQERVRLLEEERGRLLGEISELRAERTQLLETVVDMKREGFSPLVAMSMPEPPPPKQLPTKVERAIERRAERGTDLYRRLVDDAWQMLEREEMPEEAVVAITLGGINAVQERSWLES